MSQGSGFNNIRIDATDGFHEFGRFSANYVFSDSARHLSHLQTMREAIVKDMTFGCMNHLSDSGKATKGGAVEDTITVALKAATKLLRRSIRSIS